MPSLAVCTISHSRNRTSRKCHLARTLIMADIITQARELFEFSNGEILTARPFQRLLPNLAFQHDGIPIKQMFLRPLHRFGNADAIFRDNIFAPDFQNFGAKKRARLWSTATPTKPAVRPATNPFVSGHDWFPPALRATSGCSPRRVPAFRPAIFSAIHLSVRAVWKTVRKCLREQDAT